MIEDNGKMLLFDPFNSRNCSMPRVYNTDMTHEEFLEIASGNESNLCLGYCKKNPRSQGIKVVNADALSKAKQKNR